MQQNKKRENEWTVSENDIYLDLKILLDDCLRATVTNDKNCLKLDFDNGQKFVVKVVAV
ncbi:MAG: hypothetical protein NC037_05720 [Bacteroides sp.]|nr:hypothetical protein [Bacillota bacterium]MCM1393912.1 hypothetical protein [[Eubacterium] siraeum]MCM1456004.1 hypothetical protein [Bacteroides sp.]